MSSLKPYLYSDPRHPIRNGEIRGRVALLGQQHAHMPDRASAGYTNHIVHRRVIIVACPYSHYIVFGVADGQVVREVLRRPGFDSRWIDCARIARVALLLCITIQVQGTARSKFEGTRLVIAEYVGHQVCHLRTDDLLPGGDELVDKLPLRIEHSIDRMRTHQHSTIGKDTITHGYVLQ